MLEIFLLEVRQENADESCRAQFATSRHNRPPTYALQQFLASSRLTEKYEGE